MSISPIGSTYDSDEDWGEFDVGKQLQQNSSSTVANQASSQAAVLQYQLLQKTESTEELHDKPLPRQTLYFNTIYVLAENLCFDLAEETLINADEKRVWQGNGEQRARIYCFVIEKILEKGFHQNAMNLYSRALEGHAWKCSPSYQEAAKKALIEAGFHFE